MNYTAGDEAHELPRLAAPGAVLFRPARAPAAARRRAPALAGAVSRVAPDRAGPTDPDGAARRDARLRRVERDGARGPARIARPRVPPPVGRGPSGESLGSHAEGFSPPRPSARPHDHTARHPRTPVRPRATDTGTNPHASARAGGIEQRKGIVFDRNTPHGGRDVHPCEPAPSERQ